MCQRRERANYAALTKEKLQRLQQRRREVTVGGHLTAGG